MRHHDPDILSKDLYSQFSSLPSHDKNPRLKDREIDLKQRMIFQAKEELAKARDLENQENIRAQRQRILYDNEEFVKLKEQEKKEKRSSEILTEQRKIMEIQRELQHSQFTEARNKRAAQQEHFENLKNQIKRSPLSKSHSEPIIFQDKILLRHQKLEEATASQERSHREQEDALKFQLLNDMKQELDRQIQQKQQHKEKERREAFEEQQRAQLIAQRDREKQDFLRAKKQKDQELFKRDLDEQLSANRPYFTSRTYKSQLYSDPIGSQADSEVPMFRVGKARGFFSPLRQAGSKIFY